MDLWYHRTTSPQVGSAGRNHRWPVAGTIVGGTYTLTTTFTPLYPGARMAQALADSLNEVVEVAEDNNAGSCAYTINPTGGSGASKRTRPRLE